MKEARQCLSQEHTALIQSAIISVTDAENLRSQCNALREEVQILKKDAEVDADAFKHLQGLLRMMPTLFLLTCFKHLEIFAFCQEY